MELSKEQLETLAAAADAKLATEANKKALAGETEVRHEGSAIILPAGPDMPKRDAIRVLRRMDEEEDSNVDIHEPIDALPFDGAVAFVAAMRAVFGRVGGKTFKSMFGERCPTMVGVEVGHNETIQVPWGAFEIPGIEGYLESGTHDGKFCISGNVKKRHLSQIKRIVEATKIHVAENSIYKGKAFRVATCHGGIDNSTPPRFLDLTQTTQAELIFSDSVQAQIGTNLFAPVENTEACKTLGIPLKRGILLEGTYGTGKTQTAYVTAGKAVENGWTFIMLESVEALAQALVFARMYQPCVLFAEDIDRVVQGRSRTTSIDSVLNTIDGLDSKGTDIITVLTTNHVANINPAMLRPGRLDAVISVTPPDAATVEKLIHVYSRGLLEAGIDLSLAGAELAGQIPATIREVVERSKLYAIHRAGTHEVELTGEDLYHAAKGMKAHLALLEVKGPEQSPADLLAENLRIVLESSGTVEETLDKVDNVESMVSDIHNEVA